MAIHSHASMLFSAVLLLQVSTASVGQEITIPGQIPGRHSLVLGPLAERDREGRFWNTGMFKLEAGKAYTFLITSRDFQPVVRVLAQNYSGVTKGNNSVLADRGKQFVSVVEIEPEQTGAYTLCVGTKSPRTPGVYTVEIWRGRQAERPKYHDEQPKHQVTRAP